LAGTLVCLGGLFGFMALSLLRLERAINEVYWKKGFWLWLWEGYE